MGLRDFHVSLKSVVAGDESGHADIEKDIAYLKGLESSIRLEKTKTDLRGSTAAFVFETTDELIEILISRSFPGGDCSASLRFAFCVAPSTFHSFCKLVAELMIQYKLYCSPTLKYSFVEENHRVIKDPQVLEATLSPIYKSQREGWQRWVGSEQIVKLRSQETRNYFARCSSDEQIQATTVPFTADKAIGTRKATLADE